MATSRTHSDAMLTVGNLYQLVYSFRPGLQTHPYMYNLMGNDKILPKIQSKVVSNSNSRSPVTITNIQGHGRVMLTKAMPRGDATEGGSEAAFLFARSVLDGGEENGGRKAGRAFRQHAAPNLPCPKPGHHLGAHRVRRPSKFVCVALLLLLYSSDTLLLICPSCRPPCRCSA